MDGKSTPYQPLHSLVGERERESREQETGEKGEENREEEEDELTGREKKGRKDESLMSSRRGKTACTATVQDNQACKPKGLFGDFIMVMYHKCDSN